MVTIQVSLLVKILTFVCLGLPFFCVVALFSRAQVSYYLSSSTQNLHDRRLESDKRGVDSILLLTFLPQLLGSSHTGLFVLTKNSKYDS